MSRLARLVALLTAGMALTAHSAGLAGCYETPSTQDAQFPDFTMSKSLVLAQAAGSTMEFHFVDVGPNGNLCIAHGVASRVRKTGAETYRFAVAEGQDHEQSSPGFPNPACELRITATRQAVSVEPLSGNCHSYFLCGARAGVTGGFNRSTRTPLGTNGCRMLEP
jgi:hypothetical protein